MADTFAREDLVQKVTLALESIQRVLKEKNLATEFETAATIFTSTNISASDIGTTISNPLNMSHTQFTQTPSIVNVPAINSSNRHVEMNHSSLQQTNSLEPTLNSSYNVTFSGGDPCKFIRGYEKFFKVNPMSEVDMIQYVMQDFEGEALEWYFEYVEEKFLETWTPDCWEDFVIELYRKFAVSNHYSAGSSSSAASIIAKPIESDVTSMDVAKFAVPDGRGNDIPSVMDVGSHRSVRNRSGTILVDSLLPHNVNPLIQVHYPGQLFQISSTPWMDQQINSISGDIGTLSWNQPQALAYLHGNFNGNCMEAANRGVQAYHATASNGSSAVFLPPSPITQGHFNLHHPKPSVLIHPKMNSTPIVMHKLEIEKGDREDLNSHENTDSIVPEVGDHKKLLAKIVDPSSTVTQVCVQSAHDKGLDGVWSLVLGSPLNLQACLDSALKYAVHSKDGIRTKDIQLVANKIYGISCISEHIEKIATKMLLSAVDQCVSDAVMSQLEGTDQRIEREICSQETRISDSQISDSRTSENNITKAYTEACSACFELTLVGMVGLRDPHREKIHQAIKECKAAKIRVMVTTGDNKKTIEDICCEICDLLVWCLNTVDTKQGIPSLAHTIRHGLTLVFMVTKRGADAFKQWLCTNHFSSTAIHKGQMERECALRSLKLGTTFFSNKNSSLAKALVELMQEAKQQVPSWLIQYAETSIYGSSRANCYGSNKFGSNDFISASSISSDNNNYSSSYVGQVTCDEPYITCSSAYFDHVGIGFSADSVDSYVDIAHVYGFEYGSIFALARVLTLLFGPPDYRTRQLETKRYGVSMDIIAITDEYTYWTPLKFLSIESGESLFQYVVVVPPEKLSNFAEHGNQHSFQRRLRIRTVLHQTSEEGEIRPIPVAILDKFRNIYFVWILQDVSDEIEEDLTGGKIKWEQEKLNGAPNKIEEIVPSHVGEVISCLQKTSLIPGGQEPIVYGTVMGSLGALLSFNYKDDVNFFNHLEMHLSQEHRPLCGIDHMAYRSEYFPIKDVVGGDLCEQFPTLALELQRKIADELDRTSGEILKKLEENLNKICLRMLRSKTNDRGEFKPVPVAILDRKMVKKGKLPCNYGDSAMVNTIPKDATWEEWSKLSKQCPDFNPWGQGSSHEEGNVKKGSRTSQDLAVGSREVKPSV